MLKESVNDSVQGVGCVPIFAFWLPTFLASMDPPDSSNTVGRLRCSSVTL